MAWTATDNFDSYTIGNNLTSLNGGSSWATAWALVTGAGAFLIQSAPGGAQGGNAVNNASGNTIEHTRTFTAISAGTVSLYFRLSKTNPVDDVGVVLSEGAGNGRMYVMMKPTGNIQIYNEGTTSYETIQAYAADTWYQLEIDFDDAAQPNLYRARINGGTYTPYKTVSGGTFTTIDRINIADNDNTAHNSWFDDIRPSGAVAPPPETRTITIVRGG